jgi:hypothetical protein
MYYLKRLQPEVGLLSEKVPLRFQERDVCDRWLICRPILIAANALSVEIN